MLKPGAYFVKMQNAGSFILPPQAEVVHAGMAEKLNQGDHVKFCVETAKGVREKFWAKFVSYDHMDQTMVVVVDNDMVYTDLHGLKCDERLVIESKYLCAAMRY